MFEYRQIIVRLRQGDTIRGIMRSGLANRKKVRAIRQIALKKGWLEKNALLPDDAELIRVFRPSKQSHAMQSLVFSYQEQVEQWHHQGIQASTIHATLVRQHGFKGSYDCVQRIIKNIKNQSPVVTTILHFNPGECAQVDFGAGPTFID